jgi:hypothetical protein
MTWQHPTGKRPTRVSLVALGPTHHDFTSSAIQPEIPQPIWDVDEIWTLNRGALALPHDLLFVMDHLWGEAERFPSYGYRLWNHDRPIITSDNCDGWPAHVHRYPIAEVLDYAERVLHAKHGDWWHNSVPFLVVYAAMIGVRELRVWGADYHHHKSGRVEDGHPCVAYWVAKTESVGMITYPVATSTFLGADNRDWIYGYRDDPRADAVGRRRTFNKLIGRLD